MPASRRPRKSTAPVQKKPVTLLAQWMGMLGKLAVEELDDLDPEIGRLVNRLKEIAGGTDQKKPAAKTIGKNAQPRPRPRPRKRQTSSGAPASEVTVDGTATVAETAETQAAAIAPLVVDTPPQRKSRRNR